MKEILKASGNIGIYYKDSSRITQYFFPFLFNRNVLKSYIFVQNPGSFTETDYRYIDNIFSIDFYNLFSNLGYSADKLLTFYKLFNNELHEKEVWRNDAIFFIQHRGKLVYNFTFWHYARKLKISNVRFRNIVVKIDSNNSIDLTAYSKLVWLKYDHLENKFKTYKEFNLSDFIDPNSFNKDVVDISMDFNLGMFDVLGFYCDGGFSTSMDNKPLYFDILVTIDEYKI